jgi:hypothetical protein
VPELDPAPGTIEERMGRELFEKLVRCNRRKAAGS